MSLVEYELVAISAITAGQTGQAGERGPAAHHSTMTAL